MNVAPHSDTLVTPTNGMIIQSDARLEPGVYYLPDGITIDADAITLDGNGAVIIGDRRNGTGVSISGRMNVTVQNLTVQEFYHGIAARECKNLAITDCQVTGTAQVESNTVFLDIWKPADEAYGAAILLDRVTDGEIRGNDLQHQMNGLLTYHCRNLDVRQNNASYNSGFGFHLCETCDSVFEGNWADYCCRYEPRDKGPAVVGAHSVGHMGADATGFLIIQSSCRNVFRRNFARLGGDGFFLAGRNPRGESVGCNDNLFEENDGSLSPNIAFEATFSDGNIFRNNWADRCNFGFWLGYSTNTIVEGNRMLYNRQAGIATEHGAHFQVRNNDFQENGVGVLIWTRYIQELYDAESDTCTSQDWQIEKNRFYKNGTAVAIRADKDHGVRPAEASPEHNTRPHDHVIRENDIQDNRVGVHLYCADRTVIERNKLNKNVEADIRREDDRETVIGHNLGHRGAYL